jgi:SNF2 family DNA or RNA helicase
MMGTGKTLIALSYLLNFPNKKVNIICPEDLIFVWENEINKIPQIKNKIAFYSFEKSNTFLNKTSFKDEIIIIDEAQHLIPIIKLKENEISSSIKLLNTSYRTLILTGTPIYNDFTDLVYLVNLASGKNTIPYNQTKFKELYYNTNKVRSIFAGHIIPIILNINKITSNSMLLAFSIPQLYLTYTNNTEMLKKFHNLPTT